MPDRREMQRKIFILQQNIQNNIQNRCRVCYNKVESLSTGQAMQRTRQAVQRRAQSLAAVSDAVQAQSRRRITTAQAQLQSAAALAASLNPYGVLARGYTVASVGGTVTPVEHLAPGQTVTLRGNKAEADCTVLTVRKPERNATL